MATHIEIPTINLRPFRSDRLSPTSVLEVAACIGTVDVEEYDGSHGWRWRLQDPGNNKIVDAATQAFHDREECRENFRRIYRMVGGTLAICWTEVEG